MAASLKSYVSRTRRRRHSAATDRFRFWRRLALRNKFLVGFGSLILLLTLTVGVTLLELHRVEKSVQDVIHVRQPVLFNFLDFTQKIYLATSSLNGYLLTGHIEHKQDYYRIEELLNEELISIHASIDQKSSTIDPVVLHEIDTLFSEYKQYATRLFALRESDTKNYPGIRLAAEKLNPLHLAHMGTIQMIIDDEASKAPSKERIKAMYLLNEIRYSWTQMISSIRTFFTTRTTRDLQNIELYWKVYQQKMDELDRMDIEVGDNVSIDAVEELRDISTQYRVNLNEVVVVFQDEKWRADAYIMKTEVRPLVQKLREKLHSVAESQLNETRQDGHNLTESFLQIRLSAVLLFIVALVVGVAVSILLTRWIVPPIRNLMQAASHVADGQLDIKLDVRNLDEVGSLANSFNTMVSKLKQNANDKHQYMSEIEELNQSLEQRVEDRTRELRLSEMRTRTIMENIGEGILTLDECGRIETINRAARYTFGFRDDDVIGMNSAGLVSQIGTERDNLLPLFLTIEKDIPIECIGHRRDGKQVPLEVVVTDMIIDDKFKSVCVVRDVTARKDAEYKLSEAQKQIVEAAHKSGMAEIATGVLHNIGNILNSVNTSSEEIQRLLGSCKIASLHKANQMLQENEDRLAIFLTEDEKGKMLPTYYLKLGDMLEASFQTISSEVGLLSEKVVMMRDVIRTQQDYARSGFHVEEIDVNEIVRDALKVNQTSLQRESVRVTLKNADIPHCLGQRSKLLQVVTNLIKNANEAMHENEARDRDSELVVETGIMSDDRIYIRIVDNGCGISKESLAKIFNHGFTTKADGHGFGLHASANAMTEMHGTLEVESAGPGYGAQFTLTLPVAKHGSETNDQERLKQDLKVNTG